MSELLSIEKIGTECFPNRVVPEVYKVLAVSGGVKMRYETVYRMTFDERCESFKLFHAEPTPPTELDVLDCVAREARMVVDYFSGSFSAARELFLENVAGEISADLPAALEERARLLEGQCEKLESLLGIWLEELLYAEPGTTEAILSGKSFDEIFYPDGPCREG